MAGEGFLAVCEALRRAKRIGIGRVVLAGKKKLVTRPNALTVLLVSIINFKQS